MEAASGAEPKRSYSWWWDSHISPKNSKWLQDNLSDMDNKIKAMIKLIEEDADSFARRAEMYYKKRPDLMKLVEEFYRAYRALAERYDHVTGALRQAHRTIAVVFPNQTRFLLPDEPPSGLLDTGDDDAFDSCIPRKFDAIQWDGEALDEIAPFISEEGLKYLNSLFADEDAKKKFIESFLKKSLNLKEDEGKDFEHKKLEVEVSELSKENKNLRNQITVESQRADKAEAELQILNDSLSKLKSELEAAFLQYQISQERISNLESEISKSQEEFQHINDEISIKVSELRMAKHHCLGLEKENTSLQLELDKLNLFVSKQQEEASDLHKENQNLHNQVDSQSKRADRAEAESIKFSNAISKLKFEMESALLQYNVSQGRISELEAEISHTKEHFKKINDEKLIGASKLNMVEHQCLSLQEENKSLQHELDKFMQKMTRQEEEIIMREEELSIVKHSIEFERQHNMQAEIKEKSLRTQLNKLEQRAERQEEEIAIREQELNKLKKHVEDEWKQRLCAERTHQALVELHSQSQENVRHLALEIQRGTEKLRNMELSKAGLEEEIKRLRDENHSLNEKKDLSVAKIICLQDEIISLRASNHKIQDELRFNGEEKMFLQKQISSYKNKRNDLEEGHYGLMEKLKRMELREAAMEEEMRRLHDENNDLNEKILSFSSKIVNLQNEIISLSESKYRLDDELQIHLEEKKVLEQDLFSLKNRRNVLEERHCELIEQIEEVNFNVISLHAVVKELHDGNKELKDTCKKHEDEKAHHFQQLKLIKLMSENNAFLDGYLSGANAEFKSLIDKIMGLKEYCDSLHHNVISHISSKPVPSSHMEAVNQNMEKFSEKKAVIENSISDLTVEFDVLRGMVKALDESCQSLYYQKPYLIAENSNRFSQVERGALHLQSLENQFEVLEGKNEIIDEKVLADHDMEELHCSFRKGKLEDENYISFFNRQLITSSNQIKILKKQIQVSKQELEEEHYKIVKIEIDNIIMKQFFVELTKKNMLLSKECGKYMEKLKHTENFFFELKQEWTTHERKLITLSDHNVKLLEGIHVMMKTYDTKKVCESYDAKECEISNDCYDNILQIISNKIAELQAIVPVTKGEIHNFQLEKPSSFTLLEQLALILVELRSQNKVLEQESVLKNQEIFNLQRKNHEVIEINKQLQKDINASKQREEMLNLGLDGMCGRLLDLQEACGISQSEISKLLKENESLLKKLFDIREQNDALEVENDDILEEAIAQELLSLIFSSCITEKSSNMKRLISDVNYLYRITNDLGEDIRVINKSMRDLEAKNMHLKECRTHTVLFENKIQQARNSLRKLNIETEMGGKLFEQRYMELSGSSKFQGIQNIELPLDPDVCMQVINRAKLVRNGLEKNLFSSLEEENLSKDYEILCLRKSNEMLEEEFYELHGVKAHSAWETNLASEFQVSIDECRSNKAEAAKFLHDLHVSSFMELIFKEKFFELMQILKGLVTTDTVQLKFPVEEISCRNVQEEDLKEKVDVLGKENKRLKAELNAYAPLIASLENEIASLEERTLSLTNLHILNSKRKQGNLLASLQPKNFSEVRGKHHSPRNSRASAGILALKKLRAKVKVLQKAVVNTEGLLDSGEVSATKVDDETRKVKTWKLNRSTGLVGTQKKKDIILDLIKSEGIDKDVKLVKDGIFSRVKHEQIMKDIELDHVLSGSQHEVDFVIETDDHTHKVRKSTTLNNIDNYQIVNMEVERSENSSSELVLEKELSVDNIVLLPANYNESLREWIDRINVFISADAQRLLDLEKFLMELRNKIATSEMKCQPSTLDLNPVKMQVKEAGEALVKLIDFNHKLTKMTETFSLSSDSNKRRRKVVEGVKRGAEKIDGLELKLQKVQCIFLKLQENKRENKAAKPLERRSRIPLKDLIYGKRSNSRKMKRQFFACMKLKTQEI
ncbi:protein NETWORKED 1B isoform X1 [Dendrobium catenatum]|uniref:NAB domain-containing protein n=1 Tax=Dendrobium catenatum TaxID=906689 RepID=A0A2I0WL88_9ASPA|nr:protein NETWORKED 1B isoform X1 [Dendrobium catenatum]XP_020672644.1 protein NETWORKED 1B isoform X1 [Dendrobium catenatum]XP_020672653.1 protein NETWORKED 1B isoform X1 [Dendrobium catenatum]XP_028551851.1 protein NETWORKED 1B isoform X1 [Dendrobium catenatum]PKU76423.1 hypothetical protein MA16_Dca001026 [Dendrobium catenatum]